MSTQETEGYTVEAIEVLEEMVPPRRRENYTLIDLPEEFSVSEEIWGRFRDILDMYSAIPYLKIKTADGASFSFSRGRVSKREEQANHHLARIFKKCPTINSITFGSAHEQVELTVGRENMNISTLSK
jgi:hypothetical protein